KLESISAIPLYKDKSHEELRFEDYQLGSSAPTNAQSGSEFGQNTFPFGQTAGFRQSSFFGSHSSGLVGSIFSSMASLKSNAPSLATSMASLTSNAPSLAILTGTVVVTVVVTRWISLRGRRA
ncbi:nuclear pore complex protein Nup98-Nup96-like, partial [Trifolium medium]|nr:nuclear pore complex protein Nup98-Nup96-like [Trifolium medium]